MQPHLEPSLTAKYLGFWQTQVIVEGGGLINSQRYAKAILDRGWRLEYCQNAVLVDTSGYEAPCDAEVFENEPCGHEYGDVEGMESLLEGGLIRRHSSSKKDSPTHLHTAA